MCGGGGSIVIVSMDGGSYCREMSLAQGAVGVQDRGSNFLSQGVGGVE